MDSTELRARCRRFAFDVVDLAMALGTDDLARLVRPQLLRAGTGVATNYRAACRGRSRREFVSRLCIVVEEADESEFWLDLLLTKNREPRAEVQRLRAEAVELRAIFSKARRTTIERAEPTRRARL